MDDFTEAYIECAYWSSIDDNGDPIDELDADAAPELIAKMEADCAVFQERHAILLSFAYDHDEVAYDGVRAGHDFWLTRNGHGAGFWDRDLGEVGDELTKAAHTFGSVDLYVGDNGQIYGS